MSPLNLCRGCGEDFGSVALFDRHRIGEYTPGDYRGELENWKPELGRRCLTTEEMEERGWAIGARGRWIDPAKVARLREALSSTSETPPGVAA